MTGPLPEVGSLSATQKRDLLRDLLQRRKRAQELGPLSYGQQAMWFLHNVDPGNAAYNVALAFHVRGEPDPAALERSIGQLAERHAILRTSYHEYGGVPVQRVHPDRRLGLETVDATRWSQAAFDAHLVERSVEPFDLTNEPVLRVCLYSRPDARWVLFLAAHHIALDGWSFYLCLEELGEWYTAYRRGAPPDLPEVAAQYSDYVTWQRELLRGPRGAELASYWRDRLSGELAPLALSTDRPRPRTQTFRGARRAFPLDRDLTARMRTLAAATNTTLFTVLLAGLQVLLHLYTGQTDIRVASPVAHREQAAFSRVLGYFADTVVFRTDLSGASTFRALLARVAETVLGAIEHQDLPFSAVVETLQPGRHPGHAPLCDVSFVLQKSHRFALTRDHGEPGPGDGTSPFGLRSDGEAGLLLRLGDLVLQSHPLEQPVARYDLELQVMEADGAISAVLTYNTDLFDRATVESLGEHLTELLRSAVDAPDRPMSRLRLLPEHERRQLLRWGGLP